jgi:hypothetical protein
MHRTTTTHLSDALERLTKLNTRLDDVNWMPIEERIDFAVKGSLLLQSIIDGRPPEEFLDEEITFIENLIERINSVVVELSTDAQEGC